MSGNQIISHLIIFGTSLFCLLSACSHKDKTQDTVYRIPTGAVIIDVRTKAEFDSGHLANAIHIPHTEIGEKIKDYVSDFNQPIMLYCRAGRRSGIALETLKELGYVNVENGGGYEDLINRMPIEQRPK